MFLGGEPVTGDLNVPRACPLVLITGHTCPSEEWWPRSQMHLRKEPNSLSYFLLNVCLNNNLWHMDPWKLVEGLLLLGAKGGA